MLCVSESKVYICKLFQSIDQMDTSLELMKENPYKYQLMLEVSVRRFSQYSCKYIIWSNWLEVYIKMSDFLKLSAPTMQIGSTIA